MTPSPHLLNADWLVEISPICAFLCRTYTYVRLAPVVEWTPNNLYCRTTRLFGRVLTRPCYLPPYQPTDTCLSVCLPAFLLYQAVNLTCPPDPHFHGLFPNSLTPHLSFPHPRPVSVIVMGNILSCIDPVREHPPYSWPKNHPGRAEAVAKARRKPRNQRIPGLQGARARSVEHPPATTTTGTNPDTTPAFTHPVKHPEPTTTTSAPPVPTADLPTVAATLPDPPPTTTDPSFPAPEGKTLAQPEPDNGIGAGAAAIGAAMLVGVGVATAETVTAAKDDAQDEAAGAKDSAQAQLDEALGIPPPDDATDGLAPTIDPVEAVEQAAETPEISDLDASNAQVSDASAALAAAAALGAGALTVSDTDSDEYKNVTDEASNAADELAEQATEDVSNALEHAPDTTEQGDKPEEAPTAADMLMTEAEAQPRAVAHDDIVDEDIEVATTPVDEAVNGEGEGGVLEPVDEQDTTTDGVATTTGEVETDSAKAGVESDSKMIDSEVAVPVIGDTVVSSSFIDTRRAMFDKSEDRLPEVKEVQRDIVDPVTNKNMSLEEYRRQKLEQAQGLVRERVEKFEEIDEKRVKEIAEHAEIEKVRSEAKNQAKWAFKDKTKEEMEGEGDGSENVEWGVEDMSSGGKEMSGAAAAVVGGEKREDLTASTVEDTVDEAETSVVGAASPVSEASGQESGGAPSAAPVAAETDFLAGLLPVDDATEGAPEAIPELGKTRLYNADGVGS